MVKIKAQRLYDGDGYRKRAACICVKDAKINEVLLISSLSTRGVGKWLIPGGGVEPYEEGNPAETALRELKEEAGVVGEITCRIGEFKNDEKRTRTTVFLLVAESMLEDWDEKKLGRKRAWFSIQEARDQLCTWKTYQAKYIDAALDRMTAPPASLTEPTPA